MKHAGSASPLHQRMHAGSLSPPRQRKLDHHYGSDFEHAGGPHHGPGYKVRRGPGRYREFSPPPYGRGRIDRSFGRGFGSFDGLEREPSPPTEEPIGRNNLNVSPREGDWICTEPSCGNLNFARRAYCNNCNRLRFAPRGMDLVATLEGAFSVRHLRMHKCQASWAHQWIVAKEWLDQEHFGTPLAMDSSITIA